VGFRLGVLGWRLSSVVDVLYIPDADKYV